jgi:hypothetical protein
MPAPARSATRLIANCWPHENADRRRDSQRQHSDREGLSPPREESCPPQAARGLALLLIGVYATRTRSRPHNARGIALRNIKLPGRNASQMKASLMILSMRALALAMDPGSCLKASVTSGIPSQLVVVPKVSA